MAISKYRALGKGKGPSKKAITGWLEIKLRGNYFRTISIVTIFTILFISQPQAIGGDYCTASGGGDEYIYKVQVADINKVSATYTSGGYADYTATDSTEMEIGTSYDLDIISAVGGSVPNGYEGDQCGVWLDWNQDGDFSDPNELVYAEEGDGNGTYSSTITPPEGAIPGTTRMRVRLTYTGALGPCGVTEYGEVEDYTIIVTGGTTISLAPSDDTYVRNDNPDTSYGSETGLQAGKSGSTIYRILLKFNLSSIPAGQVVSSAQVQLYNGSISSPAPTLGAYRASTDNWDESTVTWNNQPEEETSEPTDQKNPSGDVTSWDVTPDVDSEYVGDGVYSVLIKSTDESLLRWATFRSQNAGIPDDAPKLVVQYAPIFAGGTGEPNNPYQIRTAEQFNSIGLYPSRWDKWYKLVEDISLASYSGASYNRIGVSELFENDGPFQGVFDGNFHSISDFSTYATSSSANNYIGLFGYVYGGTIKNLKINDPNIYTNGYAQSYAGPLAGLVEYTNVFGCRVDGGSVDGEEYVGGLIGYVRSRSFIADCGTSASVSGSSYIGGFTGCGSSYGDFPKIKDCYAQGEVTGDDYVGGFVGDSSDTEIMNCYSTGLVTGTTHTGGFSGYNENVYLVEDNVIGCYWDTTTSNQPTSAAGDGQVTADMEDPNTYLTGGWDFVGETANGPSEDWSMPDGGGYPILWHELAAAPDLPTFAGGAGSAGDPYLIGNAAQLNQIGHNPQLMDKHFKLGGDLDLSGEKYYMIANRPYTFSGTFDGAAHTISNMSIETDFEYELSYAGFIGCLQGNEASISNLILSEPNVVSVTGVGVGSLAGANVYGSINDCHVKNVHVIGRMEVGGLVGVNYNYAKISGCSVTGDISSNPLDYGSAIGGLAGENSLGSEISNSYAKCDVQADYWVGGLVGYNLANSIISNCYSQGSVTGSEFSIGGLAGRNFSGTQVNYCYTSSVVTGSGESTGGLIGSSGTGSEIYTACFWDSDINSSLDGIGNDIIDPNVIGETTANMQMANTYIARGWDFVGETANGTVDTWDICEGTNYPRLSSMIPLGDIVCPDGVDMQDLVVLCEQWLTEVQTMDVAPGGGDGLVNLEDWPALADGWQSTTDLTDLAEFSHQWLQNSAGVADIAPPPNGDGVVNLLDIALFAEDWLAGTE